MNRIFALFGLMMALGLAHVAQGQAVISVNFYNNASYQLSGSAGHVDAANWNNFATDNSGTPKTLSSLLYDNGLNSGASVAVDAQRGWQENVSTTTQSATMESSYWDTGGTDGQITISSLPAALTANG
ncbi:MAG: hypothetical protein ACI8W8_003698 [Rhodothermales bacterium]|jgi:hypothetical protein